MDRGRIILWNWTRAYWMIRCVRISISIASRVAARIHAARWTRVPVIPW
jgi:hypothetical protein